MWALPNAWRSWNAGCSAGIDAVGQEIAHSRFSAEEFRAFEDCLARETRLLAEWFEQGAFAEGERLGGFELEAWLVDRDARPAPVNKQLIESLGDPLVVPELALFNLEINGAPEILRGGALSRLAQSLQATWDRCNGQAALQGARLAMIGILPTVTEQDLVPANMSFLQRYLALDEQLARLRGGAPLSMDISGRDRLCFRHDDVMLESATTSFQIHLKINASQAGRFYNASKIIAAPMVALSANSPYLFGAELWEETRIPLFEQAVGVGDSDRTKRVTFGIRYVNTILDLFRANLQRYPVLLPQLMNEPERRLPHLRLHNGTIWRWNRPLVGFDAAGVPHLRIEHRVVPAGPTVSDSVANAAFYFGCVCALAEQPEAPEQCLPFERARENFYRAARHGLGARVHWLDGRCGDMGELCRRLLPLARKGLEQLGIARGEIERWLSIVDGRLASGQNGAAWQKRWVSRHGADMQALTEAYLLRQDSGQPVHRWTL